MRDSQSQTRRVRLQGWGVTDLAVPKAVSEGRSI